MSSTVEFKAEPTTNHYQKKVLVNKDYEQKPAAWKASFRAGKEVNETVRISVRNCFSELPTNQLT